MKAGIMSARVRWLLVAGVVLVAAGAGCGEEGGEVVSYVDSAGRSCTVDLADISSTATCDVDPQSLVTCTEGREAAIVVTDDYDRDTEIYTLESCGACVDRAAHMSFIDGDSCANITCETDEDCLYDSYSCTSGGICQRM